MITLILALACLALVLTFEAAEFSRSRESAVPPLVVIRHDPARGAPFVQIEPDSDGRSLRLIAEGTPVVHLTDRALARAAFVVLPPEG